MDQPNNPNPAFQPGSQPPSSRFSTKLTAPETLLVILLFVTTVTQFSLWGKTAVEYILSSLVDVKTSSTIYDVFIGIIAMASSLSIFIGGIYAWNLKKISSLLMMAGSIGFLLKNMLDIINDVVKLTNLVNPKSYDVQVAAGAIGLDLFQTAFWIFVIVMFTRASFKSKLS